jgi:glycosyltransferase involved in cell wall biosynthesis
VLHVLPSLDAGGAERLVVELTTAARARGVDARIAALAPAHPGSPVLADATARGLPVTVLGSHRFDPRGVARLRRVAAGADVVHAHLFPAFYAVALVCRSRTVVTEHSPTNSRRGRVPFALIERLVYRRFDVKAAISEGVADALADHLADLGVPGPVTVVHNGIELERYAPTHAPTHAPAHAPTPATSEDDREPGACDEAVPELRLVIVGTLDARKNVGEAIDAVAATEGVALTVVGDGPERRELESAVRARDAAVEFLGLRADVPDLLRAHDALIMTSRYEGFGLVAAEAMASGLPVLAPRLPGLADVVGDAGLLHEPGDLAALAAHIALLRDDPDLRGRLGERARLRSRRFDLRSTIDAYLDLYALPTGPR